MQPATAASGGDVRRGRWLPVAIIVAVIAIVVGGGQLASRALRTADGPVLRIAGVEISPAPDWDVTSVTGSPPGASLHRGPVVLDVRVSGPEATGPTSAALRYVQQRLQPELSQLSIGGPEAVVLAGGTPAARLTYVGLTPEGVAVQGVVVVATGATSSVVFDAVAPGAGLVAVADDVRSMIDQAVVP